MNCQHEWTESIRCAKCGQSIESRAEGVTALSRELDAIFDVLARVALYSIVDPLDGVRLLGLEKEIAARLALHRGGM